MALATLSIDFVAMLAKFEADMGKAARVSEKTGNDIARSLGIAKAALSGLAAGVSVAGIVALAKATVNSLDALNDLKDATGSSIENLSALEDVAARTGTSFDTVGTALVKFNGALKDSKAGSDSEAAFKALGLSVKQLKDLDPAEALLKTAKALQGFADDGNKARLVQELFGKSLREVAPFLKDLADKGALVAKVTTEQAQAAEDFNKQLFNMQKNSQDTARSIAGELLPSLNKLLENFNLMKSQGLLGTVVQDAAKDLIGLGQLTENAGADINKFIAQRDKLLEKQQFQGKTGRAAEAIRSELDQVEKLLKISRIRQASEVNGMASDFSDALSRKMKPKASVNFNGAPVKKEAEKIDDNRRALAQYVEGLDKQLEKVDELKEAEKALNFLKSLGALGQIPQVRELVLGLGEQIDKEKELAEVLKLQRIAASAAGDSVNKSNEEYQALLTRLLGATPTVKLDEQRKDVRLLTDEFEAGRVSEQLYLEAVSARLDLTAEKLDKNKTLAEELGLTFVSAAEDAIVEWKGASEVLKGLEKDLVRIITRKAVTEPFGNYVTNAIGGSGGGDFGSWLANLLPKFDVGTDYVPRDMAAIIHKGERIVPAAQNRSGSGGGNTVHLTLNQNFSPGTTRATTLQAAADASRQLQYAGRNL